MVALNILLCLTAALVALIPARNISRALIALVSILLIANNLYLLNNPNHFYLGEIFGYCVALSSEPFAVIFALMVSILYCATNFYSFFYLSSQEKSTLEQDLHYKTHFFFTPLAIMACLGVAYSANLITLFIFYELLTLFTYPLVIQSFSDSARKAGRFYFTMLFSTSSFFILFAIIFIDKQYGILPFKFGGSLPKNSELKDVLLLLICFIFGFSKTAIFPLYGWLPKAMAAPIPVSALLHAVAVVKTGIFALIKVFIYLFGIDYLSGLSKSIPWAINWITYLSCFTILFAGLMAARKTTLKKILAYSTISQLSYMILPLSFASNRAVIASFIQMLSHSIAKITLFFVAGIIYVSLHKTKITDFQGMAKSLPVPVILFILASFSIMALPFSIGYVSLGEIYKSVPHTQVIVIITLSISSLLSCYYFIKIIYKMLSPAYIRTTICYNNVTALTWVTAITFTLSFLLLYFLDKITAYLMSSLWIP
jgi:multicomponent Na+:H+ antiporter subunit D